MSKTVGTLQAVPKLLDLPIGIDASGQRHETDSMGGIDVPANRYWGADKASAIAHKANDEGLSLREAALRLGYIDAARFDEIVDPKRMVGHGVAGA